MSKHIVTNPLASIEALVAVVGVLPRPREDWRMVNPAVYGEINGLPGSAGVAVATNGVLVVVLREQGAFIGHLDSFVAYEDDSVPLPTRVVGVAVKTVKKKQNNIDIGEFV